ncbi:MAG: EscU/YscU/HrcU family type III secretion system export apparatus switch protein [Acidimicrobiales bacterium]
MANKSDRTEKATPQHKKEMRDKGTVARSQELGAWASTLLVASLLPSMGGVAANRISAFVLCTTEMMGHPSVGGAVGLLGYGLQTAAFAALPILVTGGAFAIAIAVAQVGLHITPKALRFQVSRMSPKAGLSHMFAAEGAWTLGKTILKIMVLATVSYVIMHQLVMSVLGGGTLPLQETLSASASTVFSLLRLIGALALAIAAFDYYFQRRKYQQDLRMTKQEIRDEYRKSEGNPEVRRALRSRARSNARTHMMSAVGRADVVVTNPTHYAVAISYNRREDRAPRVVAKGADYNAMLIREHARNCGVVIVENPPLARALHASCEVDDVVPPELYSSVARLLALVYSLSPTARVFRDVHVMAD